MTNFLPAILAFLLAHVIPPAPPVRARLIALLGRPVYLFAYSFLSILLLVWVVVAVRQAPLIYLWYPAPLQALVPVIAMPFAFWFIAAGIAAQNRLSITFRRSGAAGAQGTIAAIARHPVLIDFLIWSLAHTATRLSKIGAELLFELISQRYERGATLITSNLPFDEWTEILGSERLTGALLDRITHHVNILEMNGDSYRLAQSRARKAD